MTTPADRLDKYDRAVPGIDSSKLRRVMEAFSAEVRLQLVRNLSSRQMNYTDLMRSVGFVRERDSGKFSYHLKKLIKADVIRVNDKTKFYELSPVGRAALDIVKDLGKKITEPEVLMVRRTEFLMEPFDKSKIVDVLIREGGMPSKQAHEIADAVEAKLSGMEIEYLTSPLIREVANSVLVDLGYEKYRHKLTRLGMPLYDVHLLVKGLGANSDPAKIIEIAAGSVLREYALLSALPKNVADAHLSGQIDLYGLDYWLLKKHSMLYTEGILSGFEQSYFSQLGNSPESLCDYLLHVVRREFASTQKELAISGLEKILFSDTISIMNRKTLERFVKKLLVSSLTDISLRHQRLSVQIGADYSSDGNEDSQNIQTLIDSLRNVMEEMLRSRLASELLQGLNIIVTPKVFEELSAKQDGKKYTTVMSLATNGGSRVFQGDGVCFSRPVDHTGPFIVNGFCSVNIPRTAIDSGGNETRLFEGLEEAVDNLFTASSKKFSFMEEVLKTKPQQLEFLVAPVGTEETIRFITDARPFEEEWERFLLKMIEELANMLARNSRGAIKMRLANIASAKAAGRFLKADINKYGIKVVGKFLPSKEARSTHYSTSMLGPTVGGRLSERRKLEQLLDKYLSGGHHMLLAGDHLKDDVADMRRLAEEILAAVPCGALSFGDRIMVCRECNSFFTSTRESCRVCSSSGLSSLERVGSHWSRSLNEQT